MILSLAVVFIPLLALTALYTNNLPDYPVAAVDPAPELARARAEAPYPVLAPENLPTGEGGWTPTQVAWTAKGSPARDGQGASGSDDWLWGGLDPTRTYYALNQSDGDADDLIKKLSRDGVADGTSTVEGDEWQRWASPDGRTRVLARVDGDVVTAVTADASYEGLEAFAATLQAG